MESAEYGGRRRLEADIFGEGSEGERRDESREARCYCKGMRELLADGSLDVRKLSRQVPKSRNRGGDDCSQGRTETRSDGRFWGFPGEA